MLQALTRTLTLALTLALTLTDIPGKILIVAGDGKLLSEFVGGVELQDEEEGGLSGGGWLGKGGGNTGRQGTEEARFASFSFYKTERFGAFWAFLVPGTMKGGGEAACGHPAPSAGPYKTIIKQ